MTPIIIKRNAVNPRTTLEGISEEFIAWAQQMHGWNREHLLMIGTAWAPENSNALDHLVGNFVWANDNSTGCNYCNGTEHLHRTAQGYFACAECGGPKYVQKDFATAAHIAGGFVKQEFPPWALPPVCVTKGNESVACATETVVMKIGSTTSTKSC